MKNPGFFFSQLVQRDFISENWAKFKRGKSKKQEVSRFSRNLKKNILALRDALASLTYKHGPYEKFRIFDPKERSISKASVRDRLVHQLLYALLTQLYDRQFIFHSYSNRLGKGTHKGTLSLQKMMRKVSKNGKGPCYVLKMDIRRYFDSIDHELLKKILQKKIYDENFLYYLNLVIDSYHIENPDPTAPRKGIPLGNVTSQILSNIYLQGLDDYVKHVLKEPYYIRYCDDFAFVSNEKKHLEELIPVIRSFLSKQLLLELHPKKVILRKLSQGIDFLGYIVFQKYVLLRTSTRRRMRKRLSRAYTLLLIGDTTPQALNQSLQSYLGILSHAHQNTLSLALKNAYWQRKRVYWKRKKRLFFSSKKRKV